MRDVEVIVLGTAQDAGLPQLLCECINCKLVQSGALQPQHAASLGIVDSISKQFWIIDATPDFKLQVLSLQNKYPSYKLGGILLTHLHMGHYVGLLQLGKEALNSRRVPVYCTPRTAAFLNSSEPWKQLVDNENITLTEFEELCGHAQSSFKSVGFPPQDPTLPESLPISWSVEPVLVPHRGELSDTVAFIIRSAQQFAMAQCKSGCFYCPDIDSWGDWDRSLLEICRQVHVAILDGTFFSSEEVQGRSLAGIPHPLVPSTIQTLAGVNAAVIKEDQTRVVLTHMNHTNPLHRESPERIWVRLQGFEIANFGMSWTLT